MFKTLERFGNTYLSCQNQLRCTFLSLVPLRYRAGTEDRLVLREPEYQFEIKFTGNLENHNSMMIFQFRFFYRPINILTKYQNPQAFLDSKTGHIYIFIFIESGNRDDLILNFTKIIAYLNFFDLLNFLSSNF